MTLATESIDRLSSCHPDLVRVFLEVSKFTEVIIIEGGIDNSTDLQSEQLHRPSDALHASPSTGHCQQVSEWWYLGGVVTGVAKMLFDQGAIERPIEWMGKTGADLTRYRRRSDTNGR